MLLVVDRSSVVWLVCALWKNPAEKETWEKELVAVLRREVIRGTTGTRFKERRERGEATDQRFSTFLMR